MKGKSAVILGIACLVAVASCSSDGADTTVSSFGEEAESVGEMLESKETDSFISEIRKAADGIGESLGSKTEKMDSFISGIKEAADDIGNSLNLETEGKIVDSDEKKAEKCVSRYLKNLKKGNLEKADKCFASRNYDGFNESIVSIYYSDISRGYPLLERIRGFDYEILDAEAESDTAEVLVQISNADCASVIAALNISYEEVAGISDKEINRVYEAFLDETDVLDYATAIRLEKKENGWYINEIDDMREFGRALIGWCDVLAEE